MSLPVEESLSQIVAEKKAQTELHHRQLDILTQQIDVYNSTRRFSAMIGYSIAGLAIFSVFYALCGATIRNKVNQINRHQIFSATTDNAICETALSQDDTAVSGYRWDQYAEETHEARYRGLTVAQCLQILNIQPGPRKAP